MYIQMFIDQDMGLFLTHLPIFLHINFFSKGLGKSSQGRVDPVEIVILPQGKSLDVCAEMREANKVRKVDGLEPVKRKRRKKGHKNKPEPDQQGVPEKDKDVFEFLNKKVFSAKKDGFQLEKAKTAPSGSSSTNDDNLNVKVMCDSTGCAIINSIQIDLQLFKVEEDIKSLKKRRESLKQSLLRQKGR